MEDGSKTRQDSIQELAFLRQRNAEFELVKEALRKSEDRYRTLVENATDMVYKTDETGHFTFVNPAMLRITGYEEDEIIGKHYPILLRPDMRDDATKFFGRQFIKRLQNTYSEYPIITKENHELWFGQNTQLIVDNGNVVGFQAVARDITERKRAEEALRDSEIRYQSIFENTGTVMLIVEKDMTISYANAEFEKLTGYRRKEIEGKKKWTEFVEKSDLERMIQQHRLRRTDKALAKTSYEFRLVHRDDHIKDIYLIVDIIPGTKKSVASLIDITDRKRAEEALRDANWRLESIIEGTHVGTWEWNVQTGETVFNEVWAQIIGYTLDELAPISIKTWETLVHPEDLKQSGELLERHFAGELPDYDLECRMKHKDGRWVWVYDRGRIITRTGDGKPLMMFGTHTDITDRKRAEEEKAKLQDQLLQSQKMEAMGTLAGGIAHDFNNLLMGIQGYASLTLLDLDPSHPHYERLKRIEEQVQSGADLTRQLLGFARGGRYEVKPADMNDIVEKSSSMFGRTKKEISIYRKYGKDLRSVEVDRGQMEQVFMNLFVNAWQAMPGGGELYLETEDVLLSDEQAISYSVRPGRYVKVSVTDTGTGMDEKTRERIFDPFFTTKEMGRGTGLGLATVYGIIKGHGGAIHVDSEPGHGTTFNVYLPASEREVIREKTETGTIATGTETLLLVDDEKMVLEVSKEMLESLGYRVYAVGSGQEALAVYMEKRNEIDLVILDMIMPGISGGETFDRLREINSALRVLLSSGYSINGQAQEILNRGCNGFLQKPFHLEKLSGKVREMLD
jgi:two-component system cell cycle sensor histidine kinase/response regulator CckA